MAELLTQADHNAIYVRVPVCLDVNQGGTNRSCCTQRHYLACTDLL